MMNFLMNIFIYLVYSGFVQAENNVFKIHKKNICFDLQKNMSLVYNCIKKIKSFKIHHA